MILSEKVPGSELGPDPDESLVAVVDPEIEIASPDPIKVPGLALVKRDRIGVAVQAAILNSWRMLSGSIGTPAATAAALASLPTLIPKTREGSRA